MVVCRMIEPSHQQLLGHLLGALDDDEQEWLETRLEQDGTYRCQWTQWRRRLAPLDALRPEFEPPLGLAQRTCDFVAKFRVLRPPTPTLRMSPECSLLGNASFLGWRDLVMLGVLLIGVLTVALPALYHSQLQARFVACQNRLQEMGLALTQYSGQHNVSLSRLADRGRLTEVGAPAVLALKRELSPDGGVSGCPDAWLAAQGMVERLSRPTTLSAEQEPTDSKTAPRMVLAAKFPVLVDQNWPGTWRNGTATGPHALSPADKAILTDAPSVDLPGQVIAYHGGLGRNLFFSDGHAQAFSHEKSSPSGSLPLFRDTLSGGADLSAPITFVSE